MTQSAGQPLDEVQRGLEDAARRGLLVQRGDDRWTFSHVLVREAFYREMPESRRSGLHATVKCALERRVALGGEKQLSTIVHHALLSLPSGDPIDAIRTARLAADAARAQLGYEEAIALLERALSTCERFGVPDVERAEVELALGWAVTEVGEFERGRDLVRGVARIARATGNARLLARAALAQGAQYVLAEIRGELVDVLREALAALGELDDVEDRRLRARVLARLAAALTPSATPEEPLRLARAALAMTIDETDARTRIDVDVGVGAALADFAPPDERIPVNERLLRDARTVSDRVLRLRALTRLACDYLERGDVAAADATIAARADLADALGHPRYQWATPLMRSMRAMPDGRFDDCEAEIAEARRIAAEVSDPNAERCIEIHRFSMLLAAGRTEELRAQQPAALRFVASLPDALWLPAMIGTAVAAKLGDTEAAVRVLRPLGASVATAARTARATFADTALRSGVPEVYEPVYGTFSENDVLVSWGPFAFAGLPPVARLLGAIDFARGRTAEAVRHCERALSVSARIDAAAHAAWVHLTWGEGLQQHPEAREHLECAARVAEKLRMPEVPGTRTGGDGRRHDAATELHEPAFANVLAPT